MGEGRMVPRTPDGFPIRTDRDLLLRNEELEDLPLSFDARCRIFDLSIEEDLKAYTEVLDRIANGLWIQLRPDKEIVVPEKGTWKILCRWAEVKGEIPPALRTSLGV